MNLLQSFLFGRPHTPPTDGDDTMPDNIENLVREHWEHLQAELLAAKERDEEILACLSRVEAALDRLIRDEAGNYEEGEIRGH